MAFPILGANSATGGYEVENSVRFHNPSQDKLSITPSSASNRKTMTFSCWAKRSKTGGSAGAYNSLFSAKSSGNEALNIAFGNGAFSAGGDYFEVTHGSSAGGGNYDWSYRSNGLYRDYAAWYHLVAAIDTTQSSANDRIKLYVNGVEIDKTVTNSVALNADTEFNDTQLHMVGAFARDDNSHFDGYLAETHFVDGSALSPTSFGEFDDNNVWIPKRYTGSHGTNGFFLEFKQTGTSQNSSGIGADTSGNDNHFAVANLTAIDITEDTCTNNFATCNGLSGRGTDDLTNGNLVLDADASGDIIAPSTIGFSSGKWYMEMKSTITTGHGNRKTVGVYETDNDIDNPRAFSGSSPYSGVVVDLRNGSAYESADDGDATDISSFANNDICGLAYDADNGLLYVYKNGTAENSGNAINAGNALDTSKTYAFYINQDGGGSNAGELFCNFGNPSFSISSGNTDGKYGNFEYAPPSGYYALCTKRLAEFG